MTNSRLIRRALGVLLVTSIATLGLAVPAALAADTPTPTVHYTFSAATGASIPDATGNGYNGTLAGTGATYANDAIALPGGANGSGAAYVTIPSAVFAGQQDITVSVWLRNTTTNGNFAAAYVGGTSVNNGYWLFNPASPSGYVKSVVTSASAAAPSATPWTTETGSGTQAAATSTLALYTAVINGTGDTFSVYLNGTQIYTGAYTRSIADYATSAATLIAYLGRSPYADKFFSGQIDDYAVYRSALTASDVAGLFAAAPSDASKKVVTDASAAALDLGELSYVTNDLTLPASGANGTTVTWASGNTSVISNTGVVTPAGTSTSVTLTATVAVGSVTSTRTFTAVVPAALATATEAAERVRLPYVLTPGTALPNSVAGASGSTITWASSNPALVSNAGSVIGTTSGLGDVTLTASVTYNSGTATRVFPVKVSETAPAFAAGYTVTPGGMLNSSLHLALSTDGTTYTAINRNEGVAFATADFVTDPLNGVTKLLTNPYIFRMKDGSFGVIATRTNAAEAADATAASKPLFFTSPDLITFTEKGLLTLGTSLTVTRPAAEFDAAAGLYTVSWTGSDGATHVNTTSDFVTFSAPALGSAVGSAVPATGIANSSTRNRVVLTRAESDLLTARFEPVTNTTVDEPELTIVENDEAPDATDLGKITAHYSDGTSNQVPVTWDADDLAAIDTSTPGTYTVDGAVKVADYPFPLVGTAIADPQVFIYGGQYYLIGTTESASQKQLLIRKASTIAGLASATPSAIYANSTPLSWAPEVHEIEGSIYLNWATGDAWNQVKSTVVKLTGTDPTSAAAWDFANAKQVTLSDGGTIQPNGITLDMTYFEVNGDWYAIWSDRVITPVTGSANLKLASIDPADPSKLTSAPITIAKPDYGWDRNTSFVDEGANVLIHDGKIVVTFSGSGVDATYVLGTVDADADADLLSPASWVKENAPVLTSAMVPGQFGPGHNAYFTDLDGSLMTAYHAKDGASGARKSSVRAVQWGVYGNLVLDLVAARHVLPANRDVQATVTVEAAPKFATVAPTISGTSKVGSTLTASAGTWTPEPTAVTYQWSRNGASIDGATAGSYTLTPADAGAVISVTVTGARNGYATASETSVGTAAVSNGDLVASVPTITGTTTVGSALTATAGAWSPEPVSLAYQWLRGGAPIAGATTSAYLLTDADAGAAIAVTVTGTKSGYATLSSTSVAVAVPAPVVTVPQVVSTIKLSVSPAKPKITSKKGVKVTVTVKVLAAGKPGTATGTAKITIAGKSHTVKVSKGTAKYTLTIKSAKKYKVSAKYLGSATVKASTTKSTSFTVKKK